MRRGLAEFIGTALLLIAVIGSGIAAQNLSPADTGLELLENAAATGAALVAIILAVGSVSGAHLNPVVSCADAFFGGLDRVDLAAYVVAQIAGAIVGVIIANLMFALPADQHLNARAQRPNLWLGESGGHLRPAPGDLRPDAERARRGRTVRRRRLHPGAYFFTSSTSFANPAVTMARTLSDTFAGIAPSSVARSSLAQLVGAALACATVRVLWPQIDERAPRRRGPARGTRCVASEGSISRPSNACCSCAHTTRRAARWPKVCYVLSAAIASRRSPRAPRPRTCGRWRSAPWRSSASTSRARRARRSIATSTSRSTR